MFVWNLKGIVKPKLNVQHMQAKNIVKMLKSGILRNKITPPMHA
jgi:hypothetical protein